MIFNGYLRFKQHELHSEPALSENKFSDRQTLNKRFQSRTLLRDRRRLDVFSQPTFPRSLPAGFLLRCQGWISHSPSSPIPETDYRETGLGRRRRRSRNAFCYFTFNSVRKQLRGEWFSVPVRLCSFPTCTFSSLSLHWSLWQQPVKHFRQLQPWEVCTWCRRKENVFEATTFNFSIIKSQIS